MKKLVSKLAILTIMTALLLNTNIYATEVTPTAISASEITEVKFASPDNVTVAVNGQALSFDEVEKPYLKNGSTMIPLRKTVEALGAYKVNWYADLKTASFIYNGNRYEVPAKKEAEVKNGKTFIPIRFITEKMGVKVTWQQENYTVAIEKPHEAEIQYTKDGRPIRTTNLPKNAKDFPFILKDVENAMYEKTNIHLNRTAKELYETDVWVKQQGNLDLWAKKANDNLNLRLNIDYNNMPTDFAKKLKETYLDDRADDNSVVYAAIKDYVNWVKKNKIRIKAIEIRTEPTIVFDDFGMMCMRSFVKFQIISSDTDKNILCSEKNISLKNGYYEGYVDNYLVTNVMGSNGSELLLSKMNYNDISNQVKFIK